MTHWMNKNRSGLAAARMSQRAQLWCMVFLFLVAAVWVMPAQAQVSVGATISGEIVPGVYGRIDIGNAPPPPVIYTQPIIVRPGHVHYDPVYLYVPPGHAKKWSKHCARYNACNRPVYFVKEPVRHSGGYDDHRHEYKSKGKDKGKGHGRGHHD